MEVLVVPIVIAILLLVVVARAVVAVPPNTAYVVEKLGRATRVFQPGLHIVTPFVERVAHRVPLGDQSLDVPEVSSTLRSGGTATVHGTVTIRVVDPLVAVTNVADYRTAVATLVATTWKRAIGESAFIDTDPRVRATDAAIREAAAAWGLTLVHVQPSIRLSDDAEHMLMAKAEEEREQRILAWVTKRGERPGRDGRPTDAQWQAYQEWMDQEVAAHRGEIASARRLAEEREN